MQNLKFSAKILCKLNSLKTYLLFNIHMALYVYKYFYGIKLNLTLIPNLIFEVRNDTDILGAFISWL